jgi:hypothetical protein
LFIETALDELKTHLRGSRAVLRSKTPDLVRQEFYGFMMAHLAIRGLMHEATLKADEDPDRLSYIHAVRIVRRKLPTHNAIPPSGQESLSERGPRGNPARARRVQPQPAPVPRREAQDEQSSPASPAPQATAADQPQEGDKDC